MSASLHTRYPWDCVCGFFFFFFLPYQGGMWNFPDLVLNLCPLQWKCRVLTLDHQGSPQPWDWILDLFCSRLLDLICWSHQARDHSGCFSFVNLKLSSNTWKMKVGTAVGRESKTIPLGLLWDQTTNQLKNHRETRIVQHSEISQSDKMTLTAWRIKSHMISSTDTKKSTWQNSISIYDKNSQ